MPMMNERIRELRKKKGISQTELAREIDMPGKDSTLRMWELGISNPPIPSIMKLADFFEVSLDYLVGRSDLEDRRPVPVDELAIPVLARGDYRHLINEINIMIQELNDNHSSVLIMISDFVERLRLLYLNDSVPKVLRVGIESEDDSVNDNHNSRQEIIGKWLTGDLSFIRQKVVGPLESQLIEYVLRDYQKYISSTDLKSKPVKEAKTKNIVKTKGGAKARE